MEHRIQGNEYRTTMVCIDSYDSGVLVGRFSNPYLKGCETFQSLTQFLQKMELTLDTMCLPQSFTTVRTFAAPPSGQIQSNVESEFREGKLATFAIRILFRQNASWQGSIAWLEGDREQSFRSVLELVLLMDSALTQDGE